MNKIKILSGNQPVQSPAATGGSAAGQARRFTRFEWLLPLAACLSLLASTIISSPYRPMWGDDYLTYYAVSHKSFGEFCHSYASNINATPPLYFVLTWLVLKIVPLSGVSLRVMSSVACCAGLCLVWATFRRRFGCFVSTYAAMAACLSSGLFLKHSAEARFYGLYFFLIAWAVYQYARLCEQSSPSFGRLALNSLIHGLAMSCTYVAGCYSVAILAALLIVDWVSRVWRPKVYLSVVAGWLPVLFFLRLIYSQRAANNWALRFRPGPSEIYHPFAPDYDWYAFLCLFAGLAMIFFIKGGAGNLVLPGGRPAFKEKLPLAVLTFLFLMIPFGLLLLTWVGVPLYVTRYMLPTLIGVAGLLALAGSCPEGPPAEKNFPEDTRKFPVLLLEKVFQFLLIAGLLGYPLCWAVRWEHYAQDERMNNHNAPIEKNIPLATADGHTYLTCCFESGEDTNIYYIVPDKASYDQLKQFNERLNPVVAKEFLATHDRFQVLADDAWGTWFEKELRGRNGLDIQLEGVWRLDSEQDPAPRRLLLVSRKSK